MVTHQIFLRGFDDYIATIVSKIANWADRRSVDWKNDVKRYVIVPMSNVYIPHKEFSVCFLKFLTVSCPINVMLASSDVSGFSFSQ